MRPRIDFALEHVLAVMKSNLSEDSKAVERLIAVHIVHETIQEHPECAAAIDKLTTAAGLTPRTLKPPRRQDLTEDE